MNTIVCPQCNKDDTIQKVSVIVASGTSTGNYSGPTSGVAYVDGKSGNVSGYAHLSGQATTDLAKILASPPEPNKPSGLGCWWVLIWYPAIPTIAVLFAAIPFQVLMAVLSFVKLNNTDIFLFVVYSIMVISGLIGGWLGYRYFKGIDSRKKTNEEAIYRVEKPKWDNALQRWNRLYFCHRNGIVFDPDSGETCEPVSFKDFLYQSSKS